MYPSCIIYIKDITRFAFIYYINTLARSQELIIYLSIIRSAKDYIAHVSTFNCRILECQLKTVEIMQPIHLEQLCLSQQRCRTLSGPQLHGWEMHIRSTKTAFWRCAGISCAGPNCLINILTVEIHFTYVPYMHNYFIIDRFLRPWYILVSQFNVVCLRLKLSPIVCQRFLCCRFRFFFLGCCMSHTITIICNDRSQIVHYDEYPGYLCCLRSHVSIPYHEVCKVNVHRHRQFMQLICNVQSPSCYCCVRLLIYYVWSMQTWKWMAKTYTTPHYVQRPARKFAFLQI